MTEYDLGKVVGDDGEAGNGIASITKTGTSGLVDTYTITYDDGDTDTFTVTNGSDGSKGDKGDKGDTGNTGNGISSVTKTGTSGLVDTYTITFTNGNTTTFTVTNGSDAIVTIVTSWSATTSDSKVPSEKLVKNTIDGLSIPTKTSDLTNDGDGTNAFVKTNDSRLSDARTPVSHTHTKSQITDFPTLSTVATSGSYNDLSNKPSIPSSSSDLSDGSDLVKKSNTTGLIKNDGTVDTNSYLTSSAISGMLTTSDIADNLTTNDSTKVLSAKQGKVLNDLIGQAITYINQQVNNYG